MSPPKFIVFAALLAASALALPLQPSENHHGVDSDASRPSLYFGFYQDSKVASHAAGANLYIGDALNPATAFTAKAVGMDSLLDTSGVFLTGAPPFTSGLAPDWQSRWAAFQPTASAMLANGTAIGFFLGDELMHRCLSHDNLVTMARTVRTAFPNAIIWYNEAHTTIESGRSHCGTIPLPYRIPEALSWFSTDIYHFDGKQNGWVDTNVRTWFKKYVYPYLHDGQKAALVPGSFSSTVNKQCDGNCYDRMIEYDAGDFFAWATSDPKIAAIIPWHWDFAPGCEVYTDEVGTATLPKLISRWAGLVAQANIGRTPAL